MRDIKVASRYAKSLMGLAEEQGKVKEVYNDMQFIDTTCDNSKELRLFMNSPIIKADKKKAIVEQLFGDLTPLSSSFVKLIVEKKREQILPDIAQAYLDLFNVKNQINDAVVTTAVPLEAHSLEAIKSLLKTHFGEGSFNIKQIVDPSIIGGLIVRVKDKQVDESIKRKLTDLEKKFAENLYVSEA